MLTWPPDPSLQEGAPPAGLVSGIRNQEDRHMADFTAVVKDTLVYLDATAPLTYILGYWSVGVLALMGALALHGMAICLRIYGKGR